MRCVSHVSTGYPECSIRTMTKAANHYLFTSTSFCLQGKKGVSTYGYRESRSKRNREEKRRICLYIFFLLYSSYCVIGLYEIQFNSIDLYGPRREILVQHENKEGETLCTEQRTKNTRTSNKKHPLHTTHTYCKHQVCKV